ncbi:MAG: hypothetical protein O2960_16845 [Verrucomicrobia bacterium]|nr:hypothetical protein [Verrucomicrobiota bacterium]
MDNYHVCIKIEQNPVLARTEMVSRVCTVKLLYVADEASPQSLNFPQDPQSFTLRQNRQIFKGAFCYLDLHQPNELTQP